jgi:hypothetical protein
VNAEHLDYQTQARDGHVTERVLDLLLERRDSWISNSELSERSGSCAIHSRIDQLRANGAWIRNCVVYKDGAPLSYYKLLSVSGMREWAAVNFEPDPGERRLPGWLRRWLLDQERMPNELRDLTEARATKPELPPELSSLSTTTYE